MGVDTCQWRARIGLFNVGFSRRLYDCGSPYGLMTSYYLTTVFIVLFMMILSNLTMYYYNVIAFQMFCIVIIAVLRLLIIIIPVSVSVVVSRASKVVYSFRAIMLFLAINLSICLTMPGLCRLITMLYQPNILQLLLMLANDIDRNPGPLNHINFLFCNINSISADNGSRHLDLVVRLKNSNIHVAAVCESGNNLNPDNWNIDGYHTLNADLYKTKGRGMIIYIKESIMYRYRHDLDETDFENIWLDLFINHRKITFGSLYRSPSQLPRVRDKYFEALDTQLGKLDLQNDLVILGGDLNARSKMWWQQDTNTAEGNMLYDISVKHLLAQLVDEPTRVTLNSRSCLDLFLQTRQACLTMYQFCLLYLVQIIQQS